MPSHRQRNAPLERVNSGRQRRLPDNPHQHLWLSLAVYVAFPALRATVAVVQVLVRDLHLLCADEALSSIAPVSARRWRDGIRCVGGFTRVRPFIQYGTGLLRVARPDQAWQQGVFDLLVVRVAQPRLSCTVQQSSSSSRFTSIRRLRA